MALQRLEASRAACNIGRASFAAVRVSLGGEGGLKHTRLHRACKRSHFGQQTGSSSGRLMPLPHSCAYAPFLNHSI